MSEELRTSRVKVFCPRCQEVYIPKKKCPDVDGAYFGCSFPHIFLQVVFVCDTNVYRHFKIFIRAHQQLHIYHGFLASRSTRKRDQSTKRNNKISKELPIMAKSNLLSLRQIKCNQIVIIHSKYKS